MRRLTLDPGEGFRIVARSPRSQAGTLVIPPGGSTGGPTNRHAESDQWLYVRRGRGRAVVEGDEVPLVAGDLLLIEAGEAHEIVNDSDEPLDTLNVYAPPVY